MLFQTGQEWVSVAFYILGLIFAILLVSQFWSLANAIYDARQAKRLFGFIGGGDDARRHDRRGPHVAHRETVGTNTLLLWSAGALALCIVIVIVVLRREANAVAGRRRRRRSGRPRRRGGAAAVPELDARSSSLRVVITFGALGAAILDQQLNMATEEFKGRGQTDSITAFLGASSILAVGSPGSSSRSSSPAASTACSALASR